MNAWYIIHDGDPRKVGHWRLGEACHDVDAEYGEGFTYTNGRVAKKVAAEHRRQGQKCEVVNRQTLFRMLGLRDWSQQGDMK
jgi:hypothetical protein